MLFIRIRSRLWQQLSRVWPWWRRRGLKQCWCLKGIRFGLSILCLTFRPWRRWRLGCKLRSFLLLAFLKIFFFEILRILIYFYFSSTIYTFYFLSRNHLFFLSTLFSDCFINHVVPKWWWVVIFRRSKEIFPYYSLKIGTLEWWREYLGSTKVGNISIAILPW